MFLQVGCWNSRGTSWWFAVNWICFVTIAVYSRPFHLMLNCLLSVAALCVICIITSDWSGLQCFQKQTFSDESLRFRSHSVSAPGTKKILASVIAAAPLIFTPAQLLVELELLYLFVCKWFQTLFWISLASSIRKGGKNVFSLARLSPIVWLTYIQYMYCFLLNYDKTMLSTLMEEFWHVWKIGFVWESICQQPNG